MKQLMILGLVVVLMLAGCSLPGENTKPATDLQSFVQQGEWQLASITVDGTAMKLEKNWAVTLVMMDEGNLSGKAACNQFGGHYTLENGKLSTKEIAQTLMACMDDGMMALESAYLKALNAGGTLKQDGDQLVLTSADGKTELVFNRSQVSLPGTSWELASLHDEMSAALTMTPASITLTFGTDDQASGNGGCNNFFSTYTLDGEALSFGPVGSTEMACADSALSEQEVKYFRTLEAVKGYAYRMGMLQLLDADGKILASFTPAP